MNFLQFLTGRLRGIPCTCHSLEEWVKRFEKEVIFELRHGSEHSDPFHRDRDCWNEELPLATGVAYEIWGGDLRSPFDHTRMDQTWVMHERDNVEEECPWADALSRALYAWEEYEHRWLASLCPRCISSPCDCSQREGNLVLWNETFLPLVAKHGELISGAHATSKSYADYVVELTQKGVDLVQSLWDEGNARHQEYLRRKENRDPSWIEGVSVDPKTLPPEVIARNRPGPKMVQRWNGVDWEWREV